MEKTLFVASGIFHPEAGGPATYLYEILPELQKLDWKINLLSYGDSTNHSYPYAVTKVPRRTFPLRFSQYMIEARKKLVTADLVYLHTIDLPVYGHRSIPRVIKIVGDQAWERCIRKGWIPADTDIDEFQTRSYGTRADWQKSSRTRQVRSMDGVIVPSHYLKQMVMGWGVAEDKIHVIYNALPDSGHSLEISQADARKGLKLPEDQQILFTAARLAPWKGVHFILDALQQVPDVHLLIAGDGPEFERLQILAQPISDRVTFLGRLPSDKVSLYMKAADYFVLYSGYEGLPHTVLESYRAGTPVIASDKGGNPEVVKHEVNGYLVPYANPEALAASIRQSFQPGRRDELTRNLQIDLEKFQFERMVTETDRVLKTFLP